MKTIMASVAVAALVAASPAAAAGAKWQLAQAEPQAEQLEMQATGTGACPEGATETAEGEACPPDTAMAPEEGVAPEDEAMEAADAETPLDIEEPMATGSLQSSEPEDLTAGAQSEMVADSGEKFIGEQAEGAVLASQLIGLTVYNPADEALGDVNDIVWTSDGTVEAVIVGVGGFLGIGEKNVAVAYSAVKITTDENGDTWLTLNATSDELAAAPEYLTAAEKQALLEAEQQRLAPEPLPVPTAPAPEPAPAQ